jgi:hypothetical protein
MSKPSAIIMLFAISLIILSGCATQTKHFIPDNIPAIKNDMSRIVLTREDQLAGAGSPMIVIDIGEGVEPNAMLHIKDITSDEILQTENFASIAGVPNDRLWLWFNSKLVSPHYCGENGPGCIKYHSRWPKNERGQLLYGTVINIRNNCIVDFGYDLDEKIFDSIRKNELKPVEVTGFTNCDKINYTGKDRIASFVPFIDELIVKDFFKDFLQRKLQGYKISDVEGYFLLINLVADRKSYPNPDIYFAEAIDLKKISRNVQVIGSADVGDTLIWDRKPGTMRLGSAWWDGLGFMPQNIKVETGKTYFVHYTTRFMGQRWELKKVE